jgi:hypothetical protein
MFFKKHACVTYSQRLSWYYPSVYSTMSTVLCKDVVDNVRLHEYVTISHVWGEKMYSADELGRLDDTTL